MQPADFIAIVTLAIFAMLKIKKINHVTDYIAISIISFYFGKRASAATIGDVACIGQQTMKTKDYILIIAVAVIAALAYFITRKKPQQQTSGSSGTTNVTVLGSELFFDRAQFMHFTTECKNRLARLFTVTNLLTGYDKQAVKAIIAHETGWLSDPAARSFVVNNNNVLGINQPVDNTSGDVAKHFDTVNQCILFFDNLINTAPRYATAKLHKTIGEQFINDLYNAGYNSTTAWRDSVLSIYRNWQNTTLID